MYSVLNILSEYIYFYIYKIWILKFIKHATKHSILNYLNLLNTTPLIRTKMLINNLLTRFKDTLINIKTIQYIRLHIKKIKSQILHPLQTHHMYSSLIYRWNTAGVFVGL